MSLAVDKLAEMIFQLRRANILKHVPSYMLGAGHEEVIEEAEKPIAAIDAEELIAAYSFLKLDSDSVGVCESERMKHASSRFREITVLSVQDMSIVVLGSAAKSKACGF